MALSPEQSLALSTFTDFFPLVNEYLDEFLYLVIFDPTNVAVSDFTPTAEQLIFLKEIWEGNEPQVRQQISKIIKFIAVASQDTAGQVIQLLRAGTPGTTAFIFNLLKVQLPLILANKIVVVPVVP